MKRLLLLLMLLATFAGSAMAQSTTVSATITDAGSQLWKNGSYSFVFQVAPSNPSSQYYWNGVPFSSSQTIQGNLDGTASFSVSVPSSTAITPAGSTWLFQVCPAATATNGCYTLPLTISGATQSLTSTAVPPAVVVNMTIQTIGATAYSDAEITGAKTGSQYWNLTDSTIHACAGATFCTWLSIGGSSASILPSNNTFTGINTFTQNINGNLTGNASTATAATTATNLTGPGAISGAFSGNYSTSGNNSHSGSETFSGSVNAAGGSATPNSFNMKYMNNIRFASQFPGSDCGAKIVAADTDLGASAGEIWVDQSCNVSASWSTAVNLGNAGNYHVLRFTQGGTYPISAMITISGFGSGMLCPGVIEAIGNPHNSPPLAAVCMIQEFSGSNLPAIVKMVGKQDFVSGFTFDGNCPPSTLSGPFGACLNTGTPGHGVWIYHCLRCEVDYSNTWFNYNSGIQIESSTPNTTGDESAASVVYKSQSVFNGNLCGVSTCPVSTSTGVSGAGVNVMNTSDVSISESQLDSNEGPGISVVNSPTIRLVKNDVGSNGFNGSTITNAPSIMSICNNGIAVGGFVSGGMILTGGQVANSTNDQIFIDNYDHTNSVTCATGKYNVIVGVQIFPNNANTTNTWDGIKVENSAFNTITGNIISQGGAGVNFKYAVEFLSPNVTEGVDTLGGNTLAGGTTGACNLAAATVSSGNSNGCPNQGNSLLASVDLTSQAASIGSTAMFTVLSSGLYNMQMYGVVQTVGTTSTLPTACIIWTDNDSNGGMQQIFNVTASGLTNTSNTTATAEYGNILINPKVGTTVNYAFGNACTGGSAYASTGTAMTYAAHVRLAAKQQ